MEEYYEIAANLTARTKYRPYVGIICGSGLSGLSAILTEKQVFDYASIPSFPQVTVQGHAGELVFGLLDGIECVCMRGRLHYYEGNSMDRVALPVRVMRLLGVKLLVVTNAAGGLNPSYRVGDIAIISDHFGLPCLAGNTPLRGPNDDLLGQRFPAMSDAYHPVLHDIVLSCAVDLNLTDIVRTKATYCYVSGPAYESKAESRFLRIIGGDAVGMSTVPEVIAAKHCGMAVIGLSLITNQVVVNDDQTNHASHKEVLDAVSASGKHVEAIVKLCITRAKIGAFLASLPAVNISPRPLKNKNRIVPEWAPVALAALAVAFLALKLVHHHGR